MSVARQLLFWHISPYHVMKHKIGADRLETFQAVPVDPNNRLINEGPAREIQARGNLAPKKNLLMN